MTNNTASDVIPRLLTTAVGSLPHKDPNESVSLILRSLKNAPHAPQLSREFLLEQMWLQFTENIPCFRLNKQDRKYFFDTSGDSLSRLDNFFSQYIQVTEGGAPDYFLVGPEFGLGIHSFLERLEKDGIRFPFVKVQVTGPLSFALTLTDEVGKPIFYHPVFRDVAVKGMALKAVWLLETFRPYSDNIIVFFDEPILSAYGSSAFLGVSHTDVVETLDEVIEMVASRGGIPGVHCCGNTDWGLLTETKAQIINFDAVDYLDSVAIYSSAIGRFLDRGGVLAWGAVSNTEKILNETAHDVINRIRRGLVLLEKNGVDRELVRRQSIVTPACGCAGLSVEYAEKVYNLLEQIDRTAPELLLGSET